MAKPFRIRRCGAALVIAVLAVAQPAAAQSWSASGDLAGLSVAGGYNGLAFRCLGKGRARVIFSGFERRLQPGSAYTVGLSVDGIASLYETTANADGAALAVDQKLAQLEPLIERLRKGRGAEVSGPAGRYVVPLKGSGDALAAFLTRCKGP